MRDFQFGISVYHHQKNTDLSESLALGKRLKAQFLFTSLHIPEEDPEQVRANLTALLQQAAQYNYQIIADISSQTLENWSLTLFQLAQLPVDYWRLDYGFELAEIVSLSQTKGIVLNASTITPSYLEELSKKGARFENIMACHNFYPKPYSGLDMEYVKNQNQLCQSYDLKTLGFISGDENLRGPVYAGLPTVEDSRGQKPLLSALRMFVDGNCDIVLVGDPGLTDQSWQDLAFLSQGIVRLQAKLEPPAEVLYDQVLSERLDSSPYIIRSLENRNYAQAGPMISQEKNAASGKKGSIRIGNEEYGRYSGDLEICRQDIPADQKQNQLGFVSLPDLDLLPYIKQGMKYVLVKPAN